jgi:hypothetical protein
VNEVLLTAGVAAIIAAVVGGGASAFGITVPVIQSLRRQVALGLVGVAFIVASAVVGNGGGGGSDAGVKAYRQEVLAACRAVKSPGSPVPSSNGTYDRDPFIAFFRSNVESSRSVLDGLWARPVPDELKGDRDGARESADRYLAQVTAAIDRLEAELPPTFDLQRGFAALQELATRLRAPSAAVEEAMSRLADAPCTPAAGTGG